MSEIFILRSSKRLIEAVSKGNEQLVRSLLESGVNVNARDAHEEGNGVLYYAVLANNLAVLDLLLEHGAYPDDIGYGGGRAIDAAFLMGKTEFAECLLRHGARLNVNAFRGAATASAEHRQEASLFYKFADLRDRDANGLSLLHLAVMYEDVLGIEMLLSRGASVNERTLNDGLTPLHIAAKALNARCVLALLSRRANVHLKDEFGFTALHRAVGSERTCADTQLAVLKLLLDAGSKVNEPSNNAVTALHLAASDADERCIEFLLEHGAKANLKDDFGRTPLYKLTKYNETIGQSEEFQVKAIKMLLDAGADANAADAQGLTPLHAAASRAQPRCVALLLHYGARPNLKDGRGYTPLHTLASLRLLPVDKIDQIRVAQTLLVNGADVNELAHDRRTAFQCANRVNAGGVIRALLKHVAKLRCHRANEAENAAPALNRQNLESITNSARWSRYYAECNLELEKMEATEIIPRTTFRDVLTRHTGTLTGRVRNPKFVEVLNDPKYRQCFPIYYGILRRRFHELLERKEMMADASSSLSMALGYLLDAGNIVTEKILAYLTITDLQNVVALSE